MDRNTDDIRPGQTWRCDAWNGPEFIPGKEYVAGDDFGFGFLLSETGSWTTGKRLHAGRFTHLSDRAPAEFVGDGKHGDFMQTTITAPAPSE